MRTTILAVFLTAAGTNAQTPAERLARAIVIEENEHDAGQAIELYRALAEDAGAEPATRDEASLRLGLALRRIGQSEEAKAVLQALVNAGGALAARAQAALQDPGDRVSAAIREKVALFVQQAPAPSLENELVLLGDQAVPELLRRAQAGGDKAPVVLQVVLRIGGKQVVAWLEALARSGAAKDCSLVIAAMQHGRVENNDVLSALQLFLVHPDAEVRAGALYQLQAVVPARRVIELAGDADPQVRRLAWSCIANWPNLRHESGERASLAELDPHLDRVLRGALPEALESVFRFLDQRAWAVTARGRAQYLRALCLPTYEPNFSGLSNFANDDVQPDELASEVAETIRVLGPVDVTPAIARSLPTQRQRAFNAFVAGLLPYWTHASRDTALLLIANGYQAAYLVDYIKAHAQRADIVDIARDMRGVPDLVEGLLQWMANDEVGAAAFAPLRDHLDEVLAGRLPSANAADTWLATVIGLIDDEPSAAYLRSLAMQRDRYDLAVAGLLKAGSEPSRAVMRELVVLRTDRRVEDYRAALVNHLIGLSDEAVPDLLVSAYQLGIGNNRILGSLLRNQFTHPYPPEALARTAEAFLKTGNDGAFEEIAGDDPRKVAPAVLDVLCRHLFDDWQPSEALIHSQLIRLLLQSPALTAHQELLTRALARDDQQVRVWAIGAFADKKTAIEPFVPQLHRLAESDPRIAGALIDAVRSAGDPARLEIVRRYLTHPDAGVTRGAVLAFLKLSPRAAADAVIPLYESGRFNDVSLFASVAGTTLDRRFVPLLLAAMRRPDADQSMLKQALEAIRFYEEQAAHWQRILDGTNLDANSAAEALLQQARPDHKREIRLLAIGSLGALGAAETLPFLIDYTEDPDAEIAAAAKAAVTQIQLAKRPGK